MVKLSVLITTYNHEDFIVEAIESVLVQKTNFKYEIVIGEDFSTDSTRDILKKYKNKYPDVINLILQESNTGGKENFMKAFNNCKGEYIALLEGDDYWTDENKLQRQVDFLESNPQCSVCGHGYSRYHDKSEKYLDNIGEYIPKFTLEEFLKEDIQSSNRLHIRTLTRVFRKSALISKKVDIKDINLWDYVIEVILLMNGYGACLEENMGAYRVNENSFVQKNMARFSEIVIEMRETALPLVPEEYKKDIIESIENKKLMKDFYAFIDEFRSESCKDEVINYFLKNDLNSIIIYGEGDLGRLLEKRVKSSPVKLVGYIDGKNQPSDEENMISLEHLENDLNADAIVVTSFFDFDNIRNLLEKKTNIKVVSLEDTLY